MFKLLTTTLILIAASLVAGQTYVLGFDDQNENPRDPRYPVGIYSALNFTDFYTQDPHDASGNIPYGFAPTSGKRVAIYYTSKTKGAPTPSIKAHYAGSITSSLDLKSFKFGCVSARNGVAYGISRCRVAVFGYRGGVKVASQLFDFLPTSRLSTAIMVSASLSTDFRKLDTVRFATVYSPSLELLSQTKGFTGSTWFDDLEVTIYSGKPDSNTPLTTDDRCGPVFNERCPSDLCCSTSGSCGPFGGIPSGPWCAPTNCLPGWGKCDTDTTTVA